MLIIAILQTALAPTPGILAGWGQRANAGPFTAPLPVRKPLPRIKTAVAYPPPLRVPPASPYAALFPDLPGRARRQQPVTLNLAQPYLARRYRARAHMAQFGLAISPMSKPYADGAFPTAVHLPERVLPPLPPLHLGARYPLAVKLPPTPYLATITPPPPQRAKPRSTLPQLALAQYADPLRIYPPRLTLADRVLPPLPKLARAITYPPQMSLPPTPPLALIIPPVPKRAKSWPRPSLQLARGRFSRSLALPERLLPPPPPLQLAQLYPPRLALPVLVRRLPPGLTPLATLPRKVKLAKVQLAMASAGTAKRDMARAKQLRLPRGVTGKVQRAISTKIDRKAEKVARSQRQAASRSSVPVSALASASVSVSALASVLAPRFAPPTPAPPPVLPQISMPATSVPLSFAQRLVAATRAQMRQLTIYNAKYVSLSYPMGDVPSQYGVCSDVIVRAYRKVGFDLQELVYRARVGSGDTSIDHRRTSVLRKFFTRHGEVLPITDFAEDYLPGDIVSYHRPFGRSSQSHIAIVSDEIAPSGRPYLLHNRAWGVQQEDALFSDKITGHFRFDKVRAYPRRKRTRPALLMANNIPLPRRAPPRGVARAKLTAIAAWAPVTIVHRVAKATTLPVPVRSGRSRQSTRIAKNHKLSLCSPLQPAAVRARMAALCAAGARKAMALGGPRR